jgi:hypothetical protein
MGAFAQDSMLVLFAAYALVFYVIAAVTWRGIAGTARGGLVAPLMMLVAFAIVHGSADVMDVALRLPGSNPSPTGGIAAIRIVLLGSSFILLLMYGVIGLVDGASARRTILLLGLVGAVGIAAAIAGLFAEGARAGSIAASERATRLFIALPAGLLSAVALYRVSRQCDLLGLVDCRRGARVAAAGMAAYAVFAGAFATGYPQAYRLFGLPIQAYRMGAAIVIAIGLTMMLERMALSRGRPPAGDPRGRD